MEGTRRASDVAQAKTTCIIRPCTIRKRSHTMKRFLVAAAITLAGCATQPPPTAEERAAAEKPLICQGPEQCATYWQRATFYISTNSRFKIQTANENLIQTFTPTGGTTSPGYMVTREPLGGGAFRLWVKVACDNMFGCHPPMYQEVGRLKRYIETGSR